MTPTDTDLAALAQAAEHAQTKADVLREARDDAIRAAVAADDSRGAQARVARATGLNPSTVRKICKQGGEQ